MINTLALVLLLGTQQAPEIGQRKGTMYPDFLLPTIDGKLGRLSEYRGKKVLLFNFASW